MHNISSELKVVPDNWVCQSSAFKWLFSGWLVTCGFCVVVLRIFELYVWTLLRRRRRKKKEKKTKENKKEKKENVKDIIVEGVQSRLACIIFHLNWRWYQIIKCQLREFEWLFSSWLGTCGFCVVVLRFFGLCVKTLLRRRRRRRKKIKS